MPKNSHDGSWARLQEVSSLLKFYAGRQKMLENYEDLSNTKKYSWKKFFRLDTIYKSLADPYRMILENSFMKKNNLYWWVDYYSKTTYYRLRSKAIKSFLNMYKYEEI